MSEPTVFNGRYELHRRLGRGGMADVFLARDQLLDRPVAVKVLFPEFATDPNFVARFRREAQAAANLNHPNIVAVYDWGEGQGPNGSTYFIVMEYVEGLTLSEIVRSEGPLHPNRAAEVAADVAGALGFAHRNGVLHRDIKPGNVLVTANGTVKVADWGIGRALGAGAEEHLTQTGAVMGTATYFSPEQAQGHELDPRSDLYSLGVVLYEMLTARPPFSGDNPLAIAYKHVQEAPQPPRTLNPDVPPGLEAIVMSLLAKSPAGRYPSAEDLRADLRRFQEGQATLAERDRGPGATAVAAGAVGATAMAPALGATQAVGATRAEVPAAYARQETVYEEYDDEPPARRSSGFLVLLVLLVALLGVLLFFLARSLGGDGGDDDPEAVVAAVPNVVGQDQATATANLIGAGFEVAVGDAVEVDDPAQVGLVQSQDPAAEDEVEEGSTVTIVVGAESIATVPDLAGQSVASARTTLANNGFTGEIVEQPEPSADFDEGEVIRSDPGAGADAPASQAFTLFVSTGPEQVAVPEVAGLSEADAVAAVAGAGFDPSTREEPSSEFPEGAAIGTDPGAGTPLDPDEPVTVIVSTGPELVDIPDVVGLDVDEAAADLQELGFQVDAVAVAVDDESEDRVVQGQQQTGQGEPGSTVTLEVGQFVPPDDEGGGGGGGNGGGGGGGGD